MNTQKLSLDGEWKYSLANDEAKSSPAFNDAEWKTMNADALYWNKAVVTEAGTRYIWLRKKVVIPSSLKSELNKTGALALYLGKIQEEDDAWLNGKQIGSTTNGDLKRAYMLPENNILWDEENLFAIRILHWGHGGGIAEKPMIAAAKPEQVFIIRADETELSPKEPVTNEPVVYKCLVYNQSLKAVAAGLMADFYNGAGEKIKSIPKR